jgi:hypothetical protein
MVMQGGSSQKGVFSSSMLVRTCNSRESRRAARTSCSGRAARLPWALPTSVSVCLEQQRGQRHQSRCRTS